MPTYTLTITSDDLADIARAIPVIPVAQTLTICEKTEAPAEEAVSEQPATAKRGRKPKAVDEVKVETKVEAPVAAPVEPEKDEDFSDLLADAPPTTKKVTRQELADIATVVGSNLGRNTMVAYITKFSTTDKLAGVPEDKYAALFDALTQASTCADKNEAAKLLAAL